MQKDAYYYNGYYNVDIMFSKDNHTYFMVISVF